MEQVEHRNKNRSIAFQPLPSATTLLTSKSIIIAASLSLAYLAISWVLIGFRMDQLVLIAIFNGLFFMSGATRRFITAFSVFIIYWIIFDYMKAFPNYAYNTVHIESLYRLEKSLLGIHTFSGVATLNEYFALHQNQFFDFISGIFYLCWVPVPLVFAVMLYVKRKRTYFQFAFTFFLVNLIGFAIYYIYPAAPPWYVMLKGFGFDASTAGNTAGLSRFDEMTGLGIFSALYAKSSNVFAAMPSLHAAYMLIVVFFTLKLRWKWWSVVFIVITIGIWFSAVYTSHHYLLDVLAGAACSVIGVLILKFLSNTRWGNRRLQSLVRLVEKS